MPVVKVSARVTAAVNGEVASIVVAHGMSTVGLVRELLTLIAARDESSLCGLLN